MQESANYRISIKALVTHPDHNEAILLIRERGYGWELPGGGLEHSELVGDCLKRELQEETGLQLVEYDAEPSYFWTISRKNERDRPIRYYAHVVYKCSATGEITPSKEAEEHIWILPSEIASIKNELHRNTMQLIQFLK